MSPDGRLVAAVNDRGMVVLRPVNEDGGLGRRVEVPGFARAVAFAPDGRRLAVGASRPASSSATSSGARSVASRAT